MFTAYPQHIHTVLFTITLPSILTLLLHMLSFSQCDIFPQLLHNWLYKYVYSISATYTNCTVYNYSPQYTSFAVYICFPFHNAIFFLIYCTIHSTTMSIAYPQHIHTVLFTITLPSTLALLFIYAFLYTMWYFFTITPQLILQQCFQHILNIYIRYYLQWHYPVYWLCCLYMLSFSQCYIFPHLLHNSLYNNVYSISSTYTYGTVYNYTTQYTRFADYICFPFHNVIFFLNHCIIHSTTVFTAYPQHMHTVLFTITLPSILTLLLHMLSFSQCDIFPQLLHNWLYNNVSSISSTYTYGIIYNYTTQYTDFAVYICFLYTMWYFFTITLQMTLQQCL